MIEHIRHFRTSGTIAPSSPFLVSRLMQPIDFDRARTIVQLGVGTGCITRGLLDRMRPDARLIALELNPEFVRDCAEVGDPRLELLNACAGDLDPIAERLGVAEIDYVVSSLPLAMIEKSIVERMLTATQRLLTPRGLFLQYQYWFTQKGFLSRRFANVRVGFTLANLPPAFVYECSGAITGGAMRPGRRVSGWPGRTRA